MRGEVKHTTACSGEASGTYYVKVIATSHVTVRYLTDGTYNRTLLTHNSTPISTYHRFTVNAGDTLDILVQ